MGTNEKMQFLLPYINTTLLVDELTKLQHEESGGKIRVFERSGMRKDRYSGLSYNNYVALQIENKLIKRQTNNSKIESVFIIKPPTKDRKAVRGISGKRKKDDWR